MNVWLSWRTSQRILAVISSELVLMFGLHFPSLSQNKLEVGELQQEQSHCCPSCWFCQGLLLLQSSSSKSLSSWGIYLGSTPEMSPKSKSKLIILTFDIIQKWLSQSVLYFLTYTSYCSYKYLAYSDLYSNLFSTSPIVINAMIWAHLTRLLQGHYKVL